MIITRRVSNATRLKDVFAWIQKGKFGKTQTLNVSDAKMTFDAMATHRIIQDIVNKLITDK